MNLEEFFKKPRLEHGTLIFNRKLKAICMVTMIECNKEIVTTLISLDEGNRWNNKKSPNSGGLDIDDAEYILGDVSQWEILPAVDLVELLNDKFDLWC